MLALPPTIECAPPAVPEALANLREAFGGDLPETLYALLSEADGLQGWLEPSGAYLSLYTADGIVLINRMFRKNVSAAEKLLVFASDGGRKLAAFDLHQHPAPILGIPFEMERSEALFRCETLEELLDQLRKSGWERELDLSTL